MLSDWTLSGAGTDCIRTNKNDVEFETAPPCGLSSVRVALSATDKHIGPQPLGGREEE